MANVLLPSLLINFICTAAARFCCSGVCPEPSRGKKGVLWPFCAPVSPKGEEGPVPGECQSFDQQICATGREQPLFSFPEYLHSSYEAAF